MLAQHTQETGQWFTAGALELIWTRTAGQPWLVNALCREACFESEAGRDRSRAIAADEILDAQERLILARVTHLDNLADKLREERVRRVVAPMLTGAADRRSYADRDRDVEYARDLGLLAQHDAKRIANPIYAEVIPRELTRVAQDDVEAKATWYMDAGGGLDVNGLLAGFQQFFREHSEHWTQRFDRYREAGPQLLLQAYLQKVVNGGGRVEREYALGRGRVDLLILWPHESRTRRFVVECKVRRDGLERTIREGIEQTRGYMDRCGAESGHLIVFDLSQARTWEEKVFTYQVAAVVNGGDPVRSAVVEVNTPGDPLVVPGGTLPDRWLHVGDAAGVEVAEAFGDAKDEALNYAAASSATDVATVGPVSGEGHVDGLVVWGGSRVRGNYWDTTTSAGSWGYFRNGRTTPGLQRVCAP